MGTWSQPLFVTAYPPGNYTLDTSAMTQIERRWWEHSGFLSNVWDEVNKKFIVKDIFTLEEFMETHCDSHKIYDYMTSEQISKWFSLFEMLIKQNPTLGKLQFHFFCSDTQEPFYFYFNKGDKDFIMNVGSSDSLYYMEKNKDKYSERPLKFNIEKYRHNLGKIHFRSRLMKPNPTTVLPSLF